MFSSLSPCGARENIVWESDQTFFYHRLRSATVKDPALILEASNRIQKIWAYGILMHDCPNEKPSYLDELYIHKKYNDCVYSKEVSAGFDEIRRILDFDDYFVLKISNLVHGFRCKWTCNHAEVNKRVAVLFENVAAGIYNKDWVDERDGSVLEYNNKAIYAGVVGDSYWQS